MGKFITDRIQRFGKLLFGKYDWSPNRIFSSCNFETHCLVSWNDKAFYDIIVKLLNCYILSILAHRVMGQLRLHAYFYHTIDWIHYCCICIKSYGPICWERYERAISRLDLKHDKSKIWAWETHGSLKNRKLTVIHLWYLWRDHVQTSSIGYHALQVIIFYNNTF
jgi:hypothetical protein